jgi:23S rRNA pseudouridine1911/1915/1917 synthase
LPNKKIKLNIVFENDDFIVVNKPAGILVHPVTEKDKNTLANGLIYLYPEMHKVGEDPLRPGIVHRIDKDTSGLVLITKNEKSFKSFKGKFKKRQINKIYLALVFGKLSAKKGTINTSITRSKSKFNRRKISKTDEGKEAITEYEIIKEYQETSLLKVSIKTGRTHQIRVHFASLSNFIIGDKEYGSKKINSKYGLKRQFLHACELGFTYKRKKYRFEIDLPLDLKKALKTVL